MGKLTREFYGRDTLEVAPELLGKYLVRMLDGEALAVRLTEVEAYVGRVDKACHAYGYKRTRRTETLFAPPGTAYLYLIYGMYTCLNLVTEPEGEPCAVLLRAGEAVRGTRVMAMNRFGRTPPEMNSYQKNNFLNGPGKLCMALSLSREQNGLDLLGDTLYVADALPGLPARRVSPDEIHAGPRVGIDYAQEAVEFPWRFWIDV